MAADDEWVGAFRDLLSVAVFHWLAHLEPWVINERVTPVGGRSKFAQRRTLGRRGRIGMTGSYGVRTQCSVQARSPQAAPIITKAGVVHTRVTRRGRIDAA
jgi:hypothetical protein